MRSSKEKYELCKLILKVLDGSVTENEFKHFEKMLVEYEDVRQHYMLMLETYAHLQKPGHSFKMNIMPDDTANGFNSEFWKMLAKDEMESPSVSTPSIKSAPENIGFSTNLKFDAARRYSKSSWVSIILSAAAIVLLVLFVRFAPVHDTSHGQISDYCNVSFQGPKTNIYRGKYLLDESLILDKGVLEIAMDAGSTILLEAPAEIRLENDNQVFLVKGKLTAKVPPQAIGFTVRTPSASVVDYGTEFGVLVDQYANTVAQVLKGQVELRLGSNILVFEKSLRLSASQAGRVSGEELAPLQMAARTFTYEMPSAFEFYAKSLNPILYFRLIADTPDSFENVMQNTGLTIEMGSAAAVPAGPELGGSRISRSLLFSGQENGLSIGNIEHIRQHQQGDYTICFWIRFDRIGQQMISSSLVSGDTEDSRYYRIFNMNKDGHLEHSAYRGDRGKWRTVKSPMPLKADTWYFVAVTNAFKTTKNMYINGNYSSSDSEIQKTPLEFYQTIGFGGAWDKFEAFEGSLGEILLFGRTLTEAEIKALYESALSKH
jgi:hypothetical protein